MTRKSKPKNFKPDPNFPKGHKHEGKPRCQAWSNNNGRQCLGLAMKGKTKCRVHGGKSLSGIASPAWEHGGYSKVLPRNMTNTYLTMLNDPDLLTMRHEIVLIKMRIHEYVARLQTGESDKLWAQLENEFALFEEANVAQRFSEANQIMVGIRGMVKTGDQDRQVWLELMDILDVYRRLVESERKHMIEMEYVIGADQVAVTVEWMVSLIRKNFKNQEEIQAYVNDLRAGLASGNYLGRGGRVGSPSYIEDTSSSE